MELGRVVGIDGLACGGSIFGAGFCKQGKFFGQEEYDRRCLKRARTEVSPLYSNGAKMLCFSSSKEETLLHSSDGSSLVTSSYFNNAGLESSSVDILDINRNERLEEAAVTFTPSQRMELEHQALIYSYIHANAPIPATLLTSLGKFSMSSKFSALSSRSYTTKAFEWGSFELGISGNVDPELGRCRRTDGKKWRCARDAIADQKYCERHLNRGRHRSRKPVESHMHATLSSMAPSSSSSRCCKSASKTLAEKQEKICNFEPTITATDTARSDGATVNKEKQIPYFKNSDEFCMIKNPKVVNNSRPTFEENKLQSHSSKLDCGLIGFHSPFNSYAWKNDLSSIHLDMKELGRPTINEQKVHSELMTLAFIYSEHMLPHQSELSINNPLAYSDISSGSSTPAFSPLHLSYSCNPFYTSTEVAGLDSNETEESWIQTTEFETVGGPLGEALNYTGNHLQDAKKS